MQTPAPEAPQPLDVGVRTEMGHVYRDLPGAGRPLRRAIRTGSLRTPPKHFVLGLLFGTVEVEGAARSVGPLSDPSGGRRRDRP